MQPVLVFCWQTGTLVSFMWPINIFNGISAIPHPRSNTVLLWQKGLTCLSIIFQRPVPVPFLMPTLYLKVCAESLEIILQNSEISLELEWSLWGLPLKSRTDGCQPPIFPWRWRLGFGWFILQSACLLPLLVWCCTLRVWKSRGRRTVVWL